MSAPVEELWNQDLGWYEPPTDEEDDDEIVSLMDFDVESQTGLPEPFVEELQKLKSKVAVQDSTLKIILLGLAIGIVGILGIVIGILVIVGIDYRRM